MLNDFFAQLETMTGVKAPDEFTPAASYNHDLDSLEYTSEDVHCLSERVDPFLTVFYESGTRRMVGFKIKGFGYIYNKFLHPLFGESQFDPVVEALVLAFGKAGDEYFDLNRNLAYRQVREYAKEHEVTLPADFPKAA